MHRRGRAGFTYLMLLWWVAIGSVMLAALGQQWSMERKRQREVEMVYRAQAIAAALVSYHEVAVNGQEAAWPQRLEDLLEDRRSGKLQRHLRRAWKDPMTPDGQWGLMLAGSAPQSGINGVYSLAQGTPLRAPVGVSRYAEWRFEAAAVPSQATPASSEPTRALFVAP